jgi:hypothetical protein
MKKVILFSLFVFSGLISAFAQEAPPLDQYVGKFVFPEGSPVPWVEVKVVEGILVSESPMGKANLQRVENDIFTIVEYNGIAEFKRNSDLKIFAVKVSVMGLELEGTKQNLSLTILQLNQIRQSTKR